MKRFVMTRPGPMARRVAMALLGFLLVGMTTFTGVETASAASACNQPVSNNLHINNFTRQGVGGFACIGVNSVYSRVIYYSRQNASSPYLVRADTGYIYKGNISSTAWKNWTTRTVWVSVLECQAVKVSSWVRWKYPGSSTYTYKNAIRTWSPC